MTTLSLLTLSSNKTIYEHALNTIPNNPNTMRTQLTSTGAIAAYSYYGTGRIPSAKRVVYEDTTCDNIWWGKINFPVPESSFDFMLENA